MAETFGAAVGADGDSDRLEESPRVVLFLNVPGTTCLT